MRLLNKPNVRRVTIDEPTFARLVKVADPQFQPLLITAYDTGMRESEILNLRWSQVDLRIGAIKLGAEKTKTNFSLTVYLTTRAKAELERLPRHLGTDYVFVNPETGTRWLEPRSLFMRAGRAGSSTSGSTTCGGASSRTLGGAACLCRW
ncbi:MAG TPA: tyrosine-type recombinase/integrase [Anaeromyxobacteraceae bacterium]|nr:tyrosine-type recombinase/integrase [Anaeromyxobacteraceae bacterium]